MFLITGIITFMPLSSVSLSTTILSKVNRSVKTMAIRVTFVSTFILFLPIALVIRFEQEDCTLTPKQGILIHEFVYVNVFSYLNLQAHFR